MSLPLVPAPDIVAAVVAALQGVMGGDLASATGFPQVYVDYDPSQNPDGSPVAYPYAVVADGPEQYTYQSTDPETGHWVDALADGSVQVAFYATTKTQARALARAAALRLSDSQIGELASGDGRNLTIFAPRSDPIPLTQSGTGQPTVFARAVTFLYKQEFGA